MYMIPNTDLVFYCAAIRFHDGDGWVEMCGLRHSEIIRNIIAAGLEPQYNEWHEDGFMIGHIHYSRGSSKGWPMFFTQQQATEIAHIYHIPMIGEKLTSEDLW